MSPPQHVSPAAQHAVPPQHFSPLEQHSPPQHVSPWSQHFLPSQQRSPAPQQSEPHFEPLPGLQRHSAGWPGVDALHVCSGPQHAALVALKQHLSRRSRLQHFPLPRSAGKQRLSLVSHSWHVSFLQSTYSRRSQHVNSEQPSGPFLLDSHGMSLAQRSTHFFSLLYGFGHPYRRAGGPQGRSGPDAPSKIVGHIRRSPGQPALIKPRAGRGENPGTATATSDAPITRTARRRGIGAARVRARSSKKRSALTRSGGTRDLDAESERE